MKKPKTGDQASKRVNLSKGASALIADARNDITIPFFSNVLQPTDDTIIKRGGGKGLALYDEIERDTHAWSVLQKRKKTLVAREWEVKSGGEDQIDQDAADFVSELLTTLPFDRICEDLLDATLKGYAVSEIVWERADNHIVPRQIISHDQRRFVFDLEWKPRLLTLHNMNDGLELPPRKFIVHRHGVKGNNPYGLGLGTRLFWPVLFKREIIAFWITFLDKFAGPTVVGKVPYGLMEADQNKLLQTMTDIVRNTAIAVPMGTELEMLEATRSGAVSYEDACKYWDNQMSICVLGETLTTDIQGNGSRAASETHMGILEMSVDADSDLLSGTLRGTLLQWIVDYNFPGAKAPSVWRIRAADEKAQAEALKVKATAALEQNKALKDVVSTSAKFEKDDEARLYIQSLVPDDLESELLEQLVKHRQTFATTAPEEVDVDIDPKKKLLNSEPSFAEGNSVQVDIAENARRMAAGLEARRTEDVADALEQSDTFDTFRKRLLKLASNWSPNAFAKHMETALELAALLGRDAVLREMDGEEETDSFAEPKVFNQPFKEQIDFLRQKSPRPTKKWTDIMRGDHDRAFVIAGAKDRDMLADFQEAISTAIEDGTTLETFRKDFDKIVARYGWAYKGERGWRTKTIFENNIRTSYMAGRLKQMRDPNVIKSRPYWEYRHGVTRQPKIARTQHQAWHGLVLRHDDPFWDEHFPPNGFGCSCGIRTLSERGLKRQGKDRPDPSPVILHKPQLDKNTGQLIELPAGIGQGWNYQPGDLWERGLVPSQLAKLDAKSSFSVDDAEPIADLVAKGRAFKARELKKGKEPTYYVDAFLKAFSAKRGAAVRFEDKAGGQIAISDELFRTSDGALKIEKRGREVHAAQLAEAIKDPDEIWIGVAERAIPKEQGGGKELVLDRKFIRVDPKTGLLVIFELLKDVWTGRTAFHPLKKRSVKTDVNQIDKRRTGVLVYKRNAKSDEE